MAGPWRQPVERDTIELGNLIINLEWLDLSDNQFTEIPQVLDSLFININLKNLIIDGNQFKGCGFGCSFTSISFTPCLRHRP